MKYFVIFIMLAAGFTLPAGADILVNGNFADGKAHWKGDAQDVDTGGDLSLDPSRDAGVIIKLKKNKWTKLYQRFSTHEKKLRYSITFTLSADYAPDPHPAVSDMDYTPGLDDIEGVYPYYGDYSRNGQWMCITVQGYNDHIARLSPDEKKTDTQTLTGPLSGPPDEHDDMVIVFAFPPGQGVIKLAKIELVPTTDN